VIASTLLLPSALVAAQASRVDPPPSLTFDRAVNMALVGHPRLLAARAAVEQAGAGITTARQLPNPELEATAGGVRARAPGIATGGGTSLSLAQPLDLPSVRAPRIRGADFDQAAARHLSEAVALDVRAGIRQAWLEVMQRRAEMNLAIGNEGLLEEIRNRMEARVRIGEAARLELNRADAELTRARTVSVAARARVQQALAQLQLAIGVDLPPAIDVVDLPLREPTIPPLDVLRDESLVRHPAFSRLRALVARAEARVEEERALRTPQPTIIAGVDRQPETQQFLVGLALPLPLFHRREGQVAGAVAQLQQARAHYDLEKVERFGALAVAVRRADIAREQIRGYEGGLIRQAESALAAADAAWRFGERGFIDVLDAQRVLRQVRSDLLAARFEFQFALAEIERLRATAFEGEQR